MLDCWKENKIRGKQIGSVNSGFFFNHSSHCHFANLFFCFFFFFNYSYHFGRRIKAAHFIKNENRLDKTCGKWSVILLTNRWLQKVIIQARGVFILIKQNIFWTKLMYRQYGMSRLRSTSMRRRLMLKLKA